MKKLLAGIFAAMSFATVAQAGWDDMVAVSDLYGNGFLVTCSDGVVEWVMPGEYYQQRVCTHMDEYKPAEMYWDGQ